MLAVGTMLGQLFPERPLYGTSNATAIFQALRPRFARLDAPAQHAWLTLFERILLVEPNACFVSEIRLFVGTLPELEPSGASRLTRCLMELYSAPEYRDTLAAAIPPDIVPLSTLARISGRT